jgi:hypothetical protein
LSRCVPRQVRVVILRRGCAEWELTYLVSAHSVVLCVSCCVCQGHLRYCMGIACTLSQVGLEVSVQYEARETCVSANAVLSAAPPRVSPQGMHAVQRDTVSLLRTLLRSEPWAKRLLEAIRHAWGCLADGQHNGRALHRYSATLPPRISLCS